MPSAIVIGAGPGLGAAIALRFAREGFSVGVVARKQATVDAVVTSLEGAAAAVFGATADVADEQALLRALDHLITKLGAAPDVLVYNAAVIRRDRPGELSTEEHLDAYAVNVVGAITAAAYVAPYMERAGSGTIVITGGMPEPLPELTSLSLGKAGVRALTELLARAYVDKGIHVATVTVTGAVEAGTAFDPDAIADHYWRLHTQQRDDWEREVVYTG